MTEIYLRIVARMHGRVIVRAPVYRETVRDGMRNFRDLSDSAAIDSILQRWPPAGGVGLENVLRWVIALYIGNLQSIESAHGA